jgi:L-fuconolactonase
MDRAGVSAAVLVPPSWVGDDNRTALDAAATHPGRFGVMGRIELRRPCRPATIASWREREHMLGIRLTFHDPADRALLDAGEVDWLWAPAAEYGVPIMVYLPGQVASLAAVARRYPDLPLIVDHAGLRWTDRDEQIVSSIDELVDLAELRNVAVKVSALPCYVTETYPFPLLQRLIRRVIDAYGPDRVMWGSDLSRLACDYVEWLSLFTDTGLLTETEQRLVLGDALATWLRWV